jgi:nucleotide-binding universal stress UspA family protein
MTAQRILVGVDGSDHAHRALALGQTLARALGDELVVVHAVGLLDRPGATPVAAASHRDEIARAFQQEWCGSLAGSDLSCRLLLRDGDPLSVLLALVEELDPRMVVIGHRGAGGHTQRLLGSTSSQLLDRAVVSVVVVP